MLGLNNGTIIKTLRSKPINHDKQIEIFVQLATQLYHIITSHVQPDAESKFIQNLNNAVSNGFKIDFSIKDRFRGFSLLQIAITEGLGVCALPIINAGADVDIRYPNGNTTLIQCVKDSDRFDLLEVILRKTKNIDATNRPIEDGGYDAVTYCVLMYVAIGKNSYLDKFKKIVDAGAYFNVENCTKYIKKELGELDEKKQELFKEAMNYYNYRKQRFNEINTKDNRSAYNYEI